MGKSAPKPPPAPDPNAIIGAESNANDQSAILQSHLNNVNYQGPQGNVAYDFSPANDMYTEKVQLNPTEQATFDTVDNANFRAAKVADNQILNVGNALQNSNLQVPTLQTGAATGNLATGYDAGGKIRYGFDAGGPIQTQVAPTYSPFGAQGSGAPPVRGQAAPMHIDPRSAPQPGAGSGYNAAQLQFLQQHPHPGAKGQAYLASIATPQAPEAQTAAAAPQGPAAGAGAGQPDPMAAIASNPVASTQLATYAQARQMLDPQWSQAAEQQRAQLVAQGLNPNDAAWQNAMQTFGGQQNQAYDQAIFNAINAGDAEQQALYGQNLSSAQFANQAQAQQYGENQGLAQFNNASQAQANAQNAAAAAFRNQSLGQTWQEQYANAQLANQAAQQQFQDQAYSTQLPINEFTALLGDSQVALPPSSPAESTVVQPPNALGAYTLQQNALQNTYDAQMQNQQSGLGGLFNLGAAALGKFKI